MNLFQHTSSQIGEAIRAEIGGKSDAELRALISEWESFSLPRKMLYGYKPFDSEHSPLNRAQVAAWLLEERESHSWACRS